MDRIDDFEERFMKKYKEQIEAVKPCVGLEVRLQNGLNKNVARYRWSKQPTLILCSIVFCIIICVGLLYNSNLSRIENTFVLYTYADDKRVDINDKTEIKLPQVKFVRNNGELQFKGNAYFYIKGDTIKNVHMQCKNGTLTYFATKKQEDLQKSGELYVAKIVLDPEQYNLRFPFRYQDFKELWDSDALDDYKAKYFKNRSMDISDYEVEMHTSADNGILDYVEVMIQTKEQVRKESELHSIGKDITLENYKGYVIDTAWHFGDLRGEKNDLDSADLLKLSDTINITVEFLDGELKNYLLDISFDNEGNMLVKYKSDDSK